MKADGHLRLLRALALAAAACLATPALAQNVSAQTAKVIELERAGKFAEALSLAQKTLADAEKARGPVHRDVAAALNNLGHVQASLGQDVDAEPLYKRALAISRRSAVSIPLMLRRH